MLHVQEDDKLVPVRSDLKPKPTCGAPQKAASSSDGGAGGQLRDSFWVDEARQGSTQPSEPTINLVIAPTSTGRVSLEVEPLTWPHR